MKAARFIVLGVAVAAAGGAGLIAMNLSSAPPPQVVQTPFEAEPAPAIPTARVLVATQTLAVGTRLTGDELEWRDWPLEGVAEGFITEESDPDAIAELSGATVRLPAFEGEPVRRAKLVGSDERYMSGVLEPGKRAMAVELSTDNGAGGFILPNDRVDVIATLPVSDEFTDEQQQTLTAQTILSNVRVLAIDQTIEEDEEGGKTRIGETATLEITGKEAELLAYARETAASISLVLRATADLSEPPSAIFTRRPDRNVTLIERGDLRVHTSRGLK